MQARSPIPLLSIVDATAEAVAEAGLTTVGLLGTKFTMEEPFFRHGLAQFEIVVLCGRGWCGAPEGGGGQRPLRWDGPFPNLTGSPKGPGVMYRGFVGQGKGVELWGELKGGVILGEEEAATCGAEGRV